MLHSEAKVLAVTARSVICRTPWNTPVLTSIQIVYLSPIDWDQPPPLNSGIIDLLVTTLKKEHHQIQSNFGEIFDPSIYFSFFLIWTSPEILVTKRAASVPEFAWPKHFQNKNPSPVFGKKNPAFLGRKLQSTVNYSSICESFCFVLVMFEAKAKKSELCFWNKDLRGQIHSNYLNCERFS